MVATEDGGETTKNRGAQAAAFSSTRGSGRNCGYQRRNVSSNSPFKTLVRVCSKRCAPRSVHDICWCFTIRLLTTWFTVDSESVKKSGVSHASH